MTAQAGTGGKPKLAQEEARDSLGQGVLPDQVTWKEWFSLDAHQAPLSTPTSPFWGDPFLPPQPSFLIRSDSSQLMSWLASSGPARQLTGVMNLRTKLYKAAEGQVQGALESRGQVVSKGACLFEQRPVGGQGRSSVPLGPW